MDSADLGLVVLRLVIGLIFAAHGAQKAFGWWGGPGYAGWTGALQHMGMRPAPLWALVSTAAELAGGLLLALGLLTPLAAAALIGQSVVIVFAVHWAKGMWNANGGWEFPVALAATRCPTRRCRANWAARRRIREVGTRRLADEDAVESDLADEDVARHAGDVPRRVIADVSAFARLRPPVLDLVEVAVEQVDAHPVDGQPGAAVDQATPFAGLDHGAGKAEGADGIGVDPAAAVEAEVPIAVGSRPA